VQVERVEVKDVWVPEGLQRAMEELVEAAREAKAEDIVAEEEHKASRALWHAADGITGNPAARQVILLKIVHIYVPYLQLRYLQSQKTTATSSFLFLLT
jgi:erythrocyte band 7 integral membrane protein